MENFTDEHSLKHDQVVMKINNLIYVQTRLHYSHQRELKIEETRKPYKTIKNSTLQNSTMININKGDYDIITLDENDEIQVDDVSEQLESNNGQGFKAFMISQKNYVMKCNLCNHTFLTVEQFQDHNQDEEHKRKLKYYNKEINIQINVNEDSPK